jgi:hypothetical protein
VEGNRAASNNRWRSSKTQYARAARHDATCHKRATTYVLGTALDDACDIPNPPTHSHCEGFAWPLDNTIF